VNNRRRYLSSSPALLSATAALLPVALVLLVVAGSTASVQPRPDRSRVGAGGGDATRSLRAAPDPGELQEGIYVVARAPTVGDVEDVGDVGDLEDARAAEIARIRTHLAGALEQLRSSTPPGLGPEQARARERAIGWLAEYRERGVFPHNHVRPGERVPVFVDPHGTPCAVGYLLLRSGEHELVADVVREANLARIPELEEDERLTKWLEEHGLTLEEAARIQPDYGPNFPFPSENESSYAGETVGLAIVTAAAAAFAEATKPDPERFEWTGATAATSAVGHGVVLAVALRDDDQVPVWQIATDIVGAAVGAVAAGRRFARRSRAREAGEQAGAERGELSLRPYVGTSGDRVTAGVALRF